MHSPAAAYNAQLTAYLQRGIMHQTEAGANELLSLPKSV
jgi:hypothetical protein